MIRPKNSSDQLINQKTVTCFHLVPGPAHTDHAGRCSPYLHLNDSKKRNLATTSGLVIKSNREEIKVELNRRAIVWNQFEVILHN